MSDLISLMKKSFHDSSLDSASKASALKVIMVDAYDKNPSSCSHVVSQVIQNTKPELKWKHIQANQQIDWFNKNWKKIDLLRAYELANSGKVVVLGVKGDSHGHVMLVYPGMKKKSGGFKFLQKKTGKTLEMKPVKDADGKEKLWPLAISGSNGSWPGAKSRGEFTVRDPWSDADWAKVVFWADPKDVASNPDVASEVREYKQPDFTKWRDPFAPLKKQ